MFIEVRGLARLSTSGRWPVPANFNCSRGTG